MKPPSPTSSRPARKRSSNVATRNADLVASTFGPSGRHAVPGHEEIEVGLVKLFRVTGDRKYLDTAKFFIDERGQPHPDMQDYPAGNFAMYNERPYKQDHEPFVDQTRAVGHAVRAVYLYMGAADVAALTSDARYTAALDRLWEDMASKRMYLTGGIGARGTTESFGEDYELPNRRAYTETCASVGNLLWGHRMFLLHGDAKYLDVLEQVLYNGYLSGVSLSGDRFFYQNPLESAGRTDRSAYFDVACCPGEPVAADGAGARPSLLDPWQRRLPQSLCGQRGDAEDARRRRSGCVKPRSIPGTAASPSPSTRRSRGRSRSICACRRGPAPECRAACMPSSASGRPRSR